MVLGRKEANVEGGERIGVRVGVETLTDDECTANAHELAVLGHVGLMGGSLSCEGHVAGFSAAFDSLHDNPTCSFCVVICTFEERRSLANMNSRTELSKLARASPYAPAVLVMPEERDR
jgi:hypothetical protein